MSINSVSSGAQHAYIHRASVAASAPARIKDNDGDYDNGTGQDDLLKKQALQNAAQPHLGSNTDIKA